MSTRSRSGAVEKALPGLAEAGQKRKSKEQGNGDDDETASVNSNEDRAQESDADDDGGRARGRKNAKKTAVDGFVGKNVKSNVRLLAGMKKGDYEVDKEWVRGDDGGYLLSPMGMQLHRLALGKSEVEVKVIYCKVLNDKNNGPVRWAWLNRSRLHDARCKDIEGRFRAGGFVVTAELQAEARDIIREELKRRDDGFKALSAKKQEEYRNMVFCEVA